MVQSASWDASTYDQVADPQARWGEAVVERVGSAVRLLDAGCGSGRVTEQLLRRYPGLRIVALDGSEEMLVAAARRLRPWGDAVSFVHADLAAPLPDVGIFDVVFSTATLHWVHNHARLFRSLASVLEPGGRLIAQWGGRSNIASVVRIMGELGLPADRWNFASEAETEAHLRAAGFSDVTLWSHPDPATFSSREDLETFLESVVLFEALDELPVGERRAVVSAVADRLGVLSLDYVRLNAVARRSRDISPAASE